MSVFKSLRYPSCVLVLLYCCSRLTAQPTPKRFAAFPFPVVYYTPETRFVGGVGASATFRARRDSLTARPSTLLAGAAYSQNKQALFYVQGQVFYDSARWYGFGEAGYYRYNYFFFGIGENEVPRTLYAVNYPRVRIALTRRIAPKLYTGLRYAFEDYNIRDTATSGPFAGGDIPGGRGSRVSGAGPIFLYDSRDTVLFPTHGFFAEASYIGHGSALGGSSRFGRAVLDVAAYKALGERTVLAMNSYNSFVTGDAPFQQLSLLGGGRRLRGYYEGRYIDRNMAVLQAELRLKVYRRFGAAIFGGAGVLGGKEDFLRVRNPKVAYGAGLRYTVNRRDHLNIRVDYGLGPGTSGFYLTIGEAF